MIPEPAALPTPQEPVICSPYPTGDGKRGQEWGQSRAGKPGGSLLKVQLLRGEVGAVMNRAKAPLINADMPRSDVSSGKG